MFSNNIKCSNSHFRPEEFTYITKHMASCLTLQTCCYYLHCAVDSWQNSYLGGIYACSLQTFSKTLFTRSVYV